MLEHTRYADGPSARCGFDGSGSLQGKQEYYKRENFTKVAFIHGLAPGALLSSASLTKLEQQKFEVKSKNKKITTGVDYAHSKFTVVSTGSGKLIRLT